MKRQTKAKMTLVVVFLSVVCLSYFVVDQGMAQASFTYTAPVIQKTSCLGDTIEFESTLENTGDATDTYDVDMIEKPPTPSEWWLRFCAGGICYDSTVTHAEVTLDQGETDLILLDLLPRTTGLGKVTMRITSQANPSLTDSITFTLNASEHCPVTTPWGLVVLIALISISGMYLILRRLKPSKVS